VNTFPPLEGRLADAPFATRQLIVLVPDEDMRQLHAPPDAEEQEADSRLRRLAHAMTGRSALTDADARASKIRRAHESLKGQGRNVVFITHAATATLRFPRGEPIFGTLYAGHPTRPAEYFPLTASMVTSSTRRLQRPSTCSTAWGRSVSRYSTSAAGHEVRTSRLGARDFRSRSSGEPRAAGQRASRSMGNMRRRRHRRFRKTCRGMTASRSGGRSPKADSVAG
jgi:hypothetical protein